MGDFGLATELNEPNERKKTMCGTPNYIAPEILTSNDKRAYSYEVDIWAIGVITYTMLIGKAPYDGGNVNNTYANIRQNDFSFPIKDHFISHQARMFIRSILTTDPASRLSLDQMLQHPFFTDSPISPPKSLPLYILKQPYLLTSRPTTEPTPVIQRVHHSGDSLRTPLILRCGQQSQTHPNGRYSKTITFRDQSTVTCASFATTRRI